MKVAVLALTPGGLVTARRICRLFSGSYLFCHPRLQGRHESASVRGKRNQGAFRTAYYSGDLQAFIAGIFRYFNAIIFVSATGIAVRLIAPCLQNKQTDPAIIAVDDTGRFAVSLLGGHQAGANDLTEQIAAAIGAIAVITTATDRNDILAFDLLARRRGWVLEHNGDMKKISAAQLEGAQISIYCDLPLARQRDGKFDLPPYSRLVTEATQLHKVHHGAVLLSNHRELPSLPPGLPFVIIRPRSIVAGIGCRRGIPAPLIITALKEALREAGRVTEGLVALYTIELKAGEKGLREAADFFNVPLHVFSREQIQSVEHLFAGSQFVRQHTGAGAVAEPCAYLGSGGAALILGKRAGIGITVALAEIPITGLYN